MKTHTLKIWPAYFDAVANGVKTFELRLNDRNFRVGDILELLEWCPLNRKYLDRVCYCKVVYMLGGDDILGLTFDYVILGIVPWEQE